MILTKNILKYSLNDNNTLVINTMSGAFDIIDNETKKKIEMIKNGTYESNSDDKDLINTLKSRGYLYNDVDEENNTINKYRILNNKLEMLTKNNSFTICPTMGCNLRCTYCFETNDLHKEFQVMSDGQLTTILNYIKEVVNENRKADNQARKKTGKTSISLFGGEPLLKTNYEVVKRILQFSSDLGVEVKIITNGTTIKFYEGLLSKYSKIIKIQITLDGNKEIHDKRRIRADGTGSFDEICDSIDELVKLNICAALRINIDKENIKSLYKLINLIKDKKWNEAKNIITYVSPVLDFSKNDTTFKESELLTKINELCPDLGKSNAVIKRIVSPVINYLDTFLNLDVKMKPWKVNYCEATSGTSIIFTPNGRISTCLLIAGKCKSDIGTFDEKGIYFDEHMTKLWFERDVFRIPKCRECKFRFICGGGCPVEAIDVNNDIDCAVCSDIEKTLQVYIDSIKDKILEKYGV
ncbi:MULTISPECIES: radical SAM/SPASM domain-containing protein [Clostridium]|uniref:radical SAM/SPASM domain-containing protein n=1 Tax=Clostridium TaxID=1485 RepID=UPI000826091E|nr:MULTISPECIES: radical SAM protein [Clostridium]PJI10521.1 radical SAM/SPASM domain-containing protein [Clostridium sp. CT7]